MIDSKLEEEIGQRHLLYCLRGSIAHGLYKPSMDEHGIDDIDWIGVFSAPVSYYYGLNKIEQYEQLPTKDNPNDIVSYEVKKFFRLLMKCNPNIFSLLWNEREFYKTITVAGQILIDHREEFLYTDGIYQAFSGYAYSQLQKMQHGHREGYMGEKRKALVERYGYDTKNASHLVRLLTMGKEILETGKVKIFRDNDHQFLMDIKEGKYSLEEVKELAENGFSDLQNIREKSVLPSKIDYKKADSLLQMVASMCHHGNGLQFSFGSSNIGDIIGVAQR